MDKEKIGTLESKQKIEDESKTIPLESTTGQMKINLSKFDYVNAINSDQGEVKIFLNKINIDEIEHEGEDNEILFSVPGI